MLLKAKAERLNTRGKGPMRTSPPKLKEDIMSTIISNTLCESFLLLVGMLVLFVAFVANSAEII